MDFINSFSSHNESEKNNSVTDPIMRSSNMPTRLEDHKIEPKSNTIVNNVNNSIMLSSKIKFHDVAR
jgi:hypothetical protein